LTGTIRAFDRPPTAPHHMAMNSNDVPPVDDGRPPENLPRILSVLDLLTEQELVQLNHVIVQRVRLMQQIRAHGQMINFHVGQRVRFTSSAGQLVRGTIARHNRKSVTVVTADGHQWRVSPGVLQSE
jgi:hypothetical protein